MPEITGVPRQDPKDFAEVLAGVRTVAAAAAARSTEIDDARAFPVDLWDELEATGACRIMTPKDYGGLGMSLREATEAVFEGARGNGSLGWLMMVGTSQSIGNGLFAEETVRMFARDFADVRIRGAIAPRGMATSVEGGWRISGRWPFASGGPNPHFISGTCMVMEDGKPVLDDHGHPQMILATVPANEGKFIDTWRVLGMRGTDSCDIEINDAFVPHARGIDLVDMHCVYDIPAAYLPLRVVLSFPHCAVALGIVRGTIDDMIELGKTKRGSMNPAQLMGEDPVFRHEFGHQMLRYEAASAMLWQWVDRIWQAGIDKREPTPEEVLTARLMANHITSECVRIVDWAYTRAGSTPVYDGSSLQTRFRDIHVATQHASCHTDAYRHLGAAMLGVELTPRELF
jgi:alkylation response protein AidB-like acyl-CoA dehydrogenase